MDDVALIHKNKNELQKMLNITDEIAKDTISNSARKKAKQSQ